MGAQISVARAEMAMVDLRLQQLAARNQHLRASSVRTCSLTSPGALPRGFISGVVIYKGGPD